MNKWIIAVIVILLAVCIAGYIWKPRIPRRLVLCVQNLQNGTDKSYSVRIDANTKYCPYIAETGEIFYRDNNNVFKIRIRSVDKRRFHIIGTRSFYTLLSGGTVQMEQFRPGIPAPVIEQEMRQLIFTYSGFSLQIRFTPPIGGTPQILYADFHSRP